MIPVKVDKNGNVEIRAGDRATLVANRPGGMGSESVDATYFGFTPGVYRRHEYVHGRGHLFASLNNSKDISFYLAGSLKMEHWTDGDDDPSYAVGISAVPTNLDLSPSVYQYVLSKLEKK